MGIERYKNNYHINIVRCDGFCYGRHGYKFTECYGKSTQNPEDTNRPYFEYQEKCGTDYNETLRIALTEMPHGWFYHGISFVCPDCMRTVADYRINPAQESP